LIIFWYRLKQEVRKSFLIWRRAFGILKAIFLKLRIRLPVKKIKWVKDYIKL